ncbi:MAG: KpsF/GutQ family sugar-phosphate isomerase [Bacteroidaceae bacterium]|nr:KpsF/GutQ family sugar-phosphate isomerase [Bacteroidaceae bacterium]
MTNKEIAIQCLRDEAQAILSLIPQIDGEFDKAIDLVLACKGKVILTGVGKSGHIGAKIAATLSSTGTPAFYVSPLDLYHGDLGVMTTDDVVVAISHSGMTDELLRFIPYLIEEGIPIIAITSNPESLLARNATCHINVGIDGEACPLNLAPTSSTTATLAMGDALACALMERRNFKERDFARFHPGGSLGKRLLTRARDVMRSDDLPVISPGMSLGETVLHVSQGRLGLCVIVKDGKVEGIITDGDVRRAMQNLQEKFFRVPVEEVMTRHPKSVSLTTQISEIQRILQENKIHAVLVVDEDNHLLGIVDNFSCAL